MKQLEQLAEALRELTDRYGITMTEVPERLREKILQKVDAEAGTYLDVIMLPLKSDLLRPLRVRAGHRVDKSVVAEVIKNVADLDGYDMQLAEKIVRIWLTVFLVSEGDLLVASCSKIPDGDITSAAAPVRLEQAPRQIRQTVEPSGKHYATSEKDNRAAKGRGSGGYATDERSVKPASQSANTYSKLSFDDKTKKTRSESEQKSSRPLGWYENKETTPLAVNVAANNVPATAAESTSNKGPRIGEAFRRLRNGEYQVASKLMMELARAGDSRAQFHLGEFYLAGTGVEQDTDKAKYWFRKAAGQGSLPARDKLADLEEPSGQGGCISCAFTTFLIIVALKFFLSVI